MARKPPKRERKRRGKHHKGHGQPVSAAPAAKPQPLLAGREMGAAPMRAIGVRRGSAEFVRRADGAIFGWQERGAAEGKATVLRNLTPEPLDWYFHRGLIDGAQWEAGDSLRGDHFLAFRSGVHGVNYDGVHGVSSLTDNIRFSQSQMNALHAFNAALQAMPRLERKIVRAVVADGEFANHAARRHGQSARRGIQLLRDGLDALGRYYAMAGRQTRPSSSIRPKRSRAKRSSSRSSGSSGGHPKSSCEPRRLGCVSSSCSPAPIDQTRR